MSEDNSGSTRVSRRKFLVTSSVVGAAGLAGCGGSSGGSDSGGDSSGDSGGDSGMDTGLLNAEGSSTVYPISNTGSAYWNSNAPPSDGEYWGSNDEGTVPGWDQISSEGGDDMLLADFFAQQFGYEPTEQRSSPPFPTSIGL